MNEFELFTMIFYAIDAYYDDNPTDEMGVFLGMMSPFTFKELDSADSVIFAEFRKVMNGRAITLENSFMYAVEYAKTITYCDIMAVFYGISDEEWKEACKDYLSRPHKGMGDII